MSKFPIPSYSQAGEDRLIVKLLWDRLEKPGFYVDVGCNHPSEYSNTYLLYLFGWRGLVIDADPTYLSGYKDARPNDIVANVAIASEAGERAYFAFEDPGLNTLCPDVARNHQARGERLRTTRSTRVERLDAVLARHDVPAFAFMNVDVEGLDLDVLKSNDWNRYRPMVIAIEDHQMTLSDVGRSETYRFLRDLGYSLHSKVNYTSVYLTGS
ncbi:MAG: FkbM family methyltransferase [Hyphomicrobiales bacterium]|nr:FkbM family methyltransferase [Hyphomicrobiales bacterium]